MPITGARLLKLTSGRYIVGSAAAHINSLCQCTMPPKSNKRTSSSRSDDSPTNRPPKRQKKTEDVTTLDFVAEWHEEGQVTEKGVKPMIYLDGPGIKGSEKIAGFDMDGTLITTASGRTFPTGVNDWKFLNDKVVPKLNEIHKDGYKVVVFTNQAGIEKKKTDASTIMKKIMKIISGIGIPVQVFISTGESHFRKPSTEMWNFMEKKCNESIQVDKSKSYYVGDAAGRAKNWAPGKPKDFSCGDRKFAANVGIGFKTPEEFFDGNPPAKFEWRTINPVQILDEAKSKNVDLSKLAVQSKEMVLMVGPPASGKSTLTKRFLESKGYVSVNRDTLHTQEKCQKVAEESLKKGKSVVIDNTNPAKHVRKAYIDIAKKCKVPVRCLYLQTSFEVAHHLNYFRQTQSKGKQRRVPDVGYNTYKKNFEEPDLSEGFAEVKKIEFVPSFDSKNDEALFKQWTS